MTERLAKWVGRQGLEYTYAEIAKQVGVDEKTVRNVFDEYVANWKRSSRAKRRSGWVSTKSSWAASGRSSPTSRAGR
jgi:transposase